MLLLFFINCAIINSMKKFFVVSTSFIVASALAVASSTPANALIGGLRNGIEAARTPDMPTQILGDGGIFATAVNFLLFLVGAVAVIMIIFGGFRYIISGGDSGAVTNAKNTILYAVIGLIIASLAYAIIDFVLETLIGGAGTTGL